MVAVFCPLLLGLGLSVAGRAGWFAGRFPVRAGDTSNGEQAAWLDQAVSMARSSGRVRVMIIWNVDFSNYGADPLAGYAIIRPGGGCPAW